MGVVAALVRVDGWVSRGAARKMDQWATADAAMSGRPPPRDSPADRVGHPSFARAPATDADEAETPRRPVDPSPLARRSSTPSRPAPSATLKHNLSVVCPAPERLAQSSLASWRRSSNYYKRAIGAGGASRRNRVAARRHRRRASTSSRSRSSASRRSSRASGRPHLHSFVDADGNPGEVVLLDGRVARHAGRLLRRARRGQTITLKATVKKHDEYRGIRGTVLTRGEVSTPEIAAAAWRQGGEAAARKDGEGRRRRRPPRWPQ